MIRSSAYVLLGWLLIAIIGGLADVLSLTVMLPATSAVIVTHVAFSRSASLPAGLFIAIALGYLEDLHQGAPVGTLSLAHGLAFLGLRWASGRLHLGGWVLRALASVVAVALVDLLTFGTLMLLSEPLGIRREALLPALADTRWHALATLLVAPPTWTLIDRVFSALDIADEPRPGASIGGRGGAP